MICADGESRAITNNIYSGTQQHKHLPKGTMVPYGMVLPPSMKYNYNQSSMNLNLPFCLFLFVAAGHTLAPFPKRQRRG